ncbi:DPOLB-like protein [Mya arenaria]|uniref:DPOLB-like protein n=1 Tax=Mya arenaria TaxID=6604 RepID=A0ABY7DJS4_MYAAR|nr:DPOLB-like protein [Mya arenaria]
MHKYNVYRKAAGVLAKHPTKIKSGTEAKALDGIGLQIGKKIDEFIQTGQLQKLEKIRASDTNVAINELVKVTGIGPAAAQKFVQDGICTIEEKNSQRRNAGEIAYNGIAEVDKEYTAQVCGSFRRGAKTSGDIDILLTHPTFTSTSKKNPDILKRVVTKLEEISFVTDRLSLGDSKFMGVCKLEDTDTVKHDYRRIDIRLIPKDQYYCVPGEPLPVTCEEDIFDYLDMPFKKPSERNL